MALFVPNQAVVPDVSGRSIWILENGRAKMLPVQTGIRTADMLEITQGVEKGDSIIVTGLMQLREGIEVIPAKIETF